MAVHVHKTTIEKLPDEPRERTVDGAIQQILDEFGAVAEVIVVIDPQTVGKIDVRRYHRAGTPK